MSDSYLTHFLVVQTSSDVRDLAALAAQFGGSSDGSTGVRIIRMQIDEPLHSGSSTGQLVDALARMPRAVRETAISSLEAMTRRRAARPGAGQSARWSRGGPSAQSSGAPVVTIDDDAEGEASSSAEPKTTSAKTASKRKGGKNGAGASSNRGKAKPRPQDVQIQLDLVARAIKYGTPAEVAEIKAIKLVLNKANTSFRQLAEANASTVNLVVGSKGLINDGKSCKGRLAGVDPVNTERIRKLADDIIRIRQQRDDVVRAVTVRLAAAGLKYDGPGKAGPSKPPATPAGGKTPKKGGDGGKGPKRARLETSLESELGSVTLSDKNQGDESHSSDGGQGGMDAV